MLSYRILAVGRRAQDPLIAAAEDYLQRLGRYARVELVRLRPARLETERDAILAKLTSRERLIALDERGAEPTTTELAGWIKSWQQGAHGHITFLVGGSYGLHADLKHKSERLLALSRLTLPHRLALTLLAEQLYRAHSLLAGEGYHHD